MKKLIVILSILILAINAFSQTVYYPGTRVFTGVLQVNTTCNAISNEDTSTYTGNSIVNKNFVVGRIHSFYEDYINKAETVSRTIYYSSTGSDETGDGTSGTPFATPLKCVQQIAPYVIGATITISGSGTADFPITADLGTEIAKKTFINSTLAFFGATINDVETGFTMSKTSSRLFAYTLSKTGLTATENQYRGNFVTTTAKSQFYPIAYNAAGTNSFEVEFTHNNLTTQTNIATFGVTWTNPGNISTFLDYNFSASSGNCQITFDRMNFNCGTTADINFYGNTFKDFTRTYITAKAIILGGNNPLQFVSPRFVNTALIQSTASGAFIWLYNNVQATFARSFIWSQYANSQGCFYMYNCYTTTKFNNGVYVLGNGTGSAIYSNIGNSLLPITTGIKVKNFANYIGVGQGLRIVPGNPTTSANVYHEFTTVTNLLSALPPSGFVLNIPYLYGSLPTNLINSVSSGFVFVDPKNDIHVSVPGIYGELENTSATLTDNTATNVVIGNTAQNNSIHVEYTIKRGTGYRTGSFDILYDGSTTYLSPDEFIDNGVAEVDAASIAFTTSISGTDIRLTGTLDSSGNNATFQYSITRKMK
ncbi:MAG: hypothetical protein PHW73_00440 [Atribacterota bacterium]|nr:hypothetical protein [Atribacterota bacterium]